MADGRMVFILVFPPLMMMMMTCSPAHLNVRICSIAANGRVGGINTGNVFNQLQSVVYSVWCSLEECCQWSACG